LIFEEQIDATIYGSPAIRYIFFASFDKLRMTAKKDAAAIRSI